MRYSEYGERYLSLCERIGQVADELMRPPPMLLAVSKGKPAVAIRDVFELGQQHFGENYLQEALDKQAEVNALLTQARADQTPLCWHYIGHIQSNKTRDIAAHFDWVQTVDRWKIAKRLNDQRPDHLNPLNVTVQVNISNESQKSGIQPDELMDLAKAIEGCERLQLRGIMAIPAPDTSETQARLRDDFAAMHARFETLQMHYPHIDTLSIGMSNDMELAIQSGSTMIRVGTALFGERSD